ncbi:MAG: hypothetical protein ACXIUZ_13600 [Lysobacteraceae bacterium]
MSRTRKPRRTSSKQPTGPRAVFLAGLGAASLARKQALQVAGRAQARAVRARQQAADLVEHAADRADRALKPILTRFGLA